MREHIRKYSITMGEQKFEWVSICESIRLQHRTSD